ncbi:hypothetical protein AABB24_012412 [Solanum stoloniferum]|uniref:Uncharacterized protein n=1 Tax=Solanum stoloniferum TaxID=62892 RepID=A0ABD2U3K3_9SOLN
MGSDPHTEFLLGLLGISGKILRESVIDEKYITDRILALEHCKDKDTAVKTAKTIIFLGFQEPTEIPSSCKSPFEVTCLRMEEKLAYSKTEQDMVLLHHEVVVVTQTTMLKLIDRHSWQWEGQRMGKPPWPWLLQ